jgi:hypothetical protein
MQRGKAGLDQPNITPSRVRFLRREPTWSRMIPFGIGAVTATSIVSDKMRSSHSWVRHIWWLPQVGSIGGMAAVKIDWKTDPLWR